VDLHRFDTDSDPDPAFHFFYADPDPDPVPIPSFTNVRTGLVYIVLSFFSAL
jgi:hypothetical protein